MYMQRYFGIIKNNKVKINNDDFHHIKNVMRMKVNDRIEVVNNKKTYICNIDNLDNGIDLSVLNEIEENNELPVKVTVVQALVNETKMDYILQKGTELGAYSFIPLNMERCITKIDKNKETKKIQRWNTICKEASEQSKRNNISIVDHIYNINELVELDYDLKLICSVNERVNTIKSILQNAVEYDKLLIVIGPEGGISDKEEEILINNGFIRVSLGTRVLRTETASSFILSVINYEFMR